MSTPRPFTLYLYAESPLHVGGGESLSHVDLPIQRERLTKIPMVPGSGLRGALREQLRSLDQAAPGEPGKGHPLRGDWFGNEHTDISAASEATPKMERFWAGAVHLDDARLLLMPVRSLRHGWAWVTAKLALDRLARDHDDTRFEWREAPRPGEAWVADKEALIRPNGDKGAVLLDDLELDGRVNERVLELAAWIQETCLPDHDGFSPFRERVPGQLVVVADEDFKELCQTATEVVTRVRIDPTRHVAADGALWTEELLPAEALLWAPGLVTDSRKPRRNGEEPYEAEKLLNGFAEAVMRVRRIRLGGDQGIGRGRVALTLQVRDDEETRHG